MPLITEAHMRRAIALALSGIIGFYGRAVPLTWGDAVEIEEARAQVLRAKGLTTALARATMYEGRESGLGHEHAYAYAAAALCDQVERALEGGEGEAARVVVEGWRRRTCFTWGWYGKRQRSFFFACMLEQAQPIDIERSLRTQAMRVAWAADRGRRPCRPTTPRVRRLRRQPALLSAVRRYVSEPVQQTIPRLWSHPPVACVHMPRGAVPTEYVLTQHAAERPAPARPHCDERRAASRCCATTRSGNSEHEKVAKPPTESARIPIPSAAFRLAVCSPACCHAPRVLHGYPTLVVIFLTTCRAPPRRPPASLPSTSEAPGRFVLADGVGAMR